MKRIPVILALALLLTLASACDFFRVVAGRPTSADLAARKETIIAQQLAEQKARERAIFVRDSLAAIEKHRADSVEAAAWFKQARVSMIRTGQLAGLRKEDLTRRYGIILAGFADPRNADKFQASLSEGGYDAFQLHYARGSHALVGVCPTDDLSVLRETYERVRKEKFCPVDAWILINENI